MGGCCSRDVVVEAPEVIIPDPAENEVCQFTIKQAAFASRDYVAYRGTNTEDDAGKWYFLNKSGSKWGGDVCIEVENFVRIDPDDKDKGQILWRADFRDNPSFQQQIRNAGMSLFQMQFNGWGNPYPSNWGDDHYYMGRGGWDRDYVCTLFINWTMRSGATLTSAMRTGWGFPVQIGIYAQGTAVARYYEVDVPVYDQRQVGVNDDGSPVFERVQVGWRSEWQKHVREYVDYVQFALLNAQTGVPVIMSDGNACVLNIPGDATDWTSNYSTPFFTVRQQGGWFTKEPPTVDTMPGVDPTLALLMAHLMTKEYSTSAIKDAFHPHFPYHPRQGIMFGLMQGGY